MPVLFITGNKRKFEEVKAVLPEIEQLDVDLPEIQEIDAKAVIRAKLLEALKHRQGDVIVEDSSLCFDCLNGLPGPLIKWVLKALGNDGLYLLAVKCGVFGAEARTTFGLARGPERIYYFEASCRGEIVRPRGDKDFGWGPIFQPAGSTLTYGEMDREAKHRFSMRGQAARKLRDFLKENIR